MKLEDRIGFLGFGNMGGAILEGLLKTQTIPAASARVYDVDAEKCRRAQLLGAWIAESPSALAQESDVVVLAVKPQMMDAALEQIKPGVTDRVLIVSIAAGISIDYIQNRLGREIHVVRAMPNTPALVGVGATAFALSDTCSTRDAECAQAIFDAVGHAERVQESLIDAVTALSGSGPAYFFFMVECMVRAAVSHGMPEDQATRLAAQTLLGAGKLLKESGESPATLRSRVTSKGGTTEAALNQFAAEGFERVINAGIAAAVTRAKELGR